MSPKQQKTAARSWSGRLFAGSAGKKPQARENLLRIEAFEQGRVRCENCAHGASLEGLEPLSMMPCPRCDSVNLVSLRLGEYLLFQPLGGGAMGSVYKACRASAPDAFFAVKVLPRLEKRKPTLVHALLNEARIAQLLGDHPSLVSCASQGEDDGEYYCAYEFIDGLRLDKVINREGGLPEEAVLNIGLQIVAGEQRLFEKGYLYRDLKLENLMLKDNDNVVMLDYGLCIPLQEAQNPAGNFICGSAYYLPPERIWGEGEGPWSEIYSLGMVLYHCFVGKPYYEGDTFEDIARKHVLADRERNAAKMAALRPAFARVLSKMIAKDGKDRYQTFEEVDVLLRRLECCCH